MNTGMDEARLTADMDAKELCKALTDYWNAHVQVLSGTRMEKSEAVLRAAGEMPERLRPVFLGYRRNDDLCYGRMVDICYEKNGQSLYVGSLMNPGTGPCVTELQLIREIAEAEGKTFDEAVTGYYVNELDKEIADLKERKDGLAERLRKAMEMRDAFTSGELARAKRLIDEFCEREYGSGADFSDLNNVGLAYTELEDGRIVETFADLESPALHTYVNGKLCFHTEYGTLDELIRNELEFLDFDALVRLDGDGPGLGTPPEGTARTEYALEVFEGGSGRFLEQVDVYHDYCEAREEAEGMPPLDENQEYGITAIYYDKDDNEIGTERLEMTDMEQDGPER